MEETVKDQQTPLPGNSGRSKLQRYALRSVTKSKEEKLPVSDLTNPSSSAASKRGRSISSVSKSVGVLDLSAKDKSAKPPRRLSVPTKNVSPARKPVGSITPISEVRMKSVRSQGKSQTPASDISRSSRKTFNILFSASYWLSQIKLSEAAAKHSLSLGFFKLALEAGCKPVQRMRDEFKSYIQRCNLDESEQTVKDLLESYNVAEESEQLQVSETCSQAPEAGTRSSDDDVHSTSSTVGPRKLKPKSLNTDASQTKPVTEVTATPRTRGSGNKNVTPRSVSETTTLKSVKKPQKPSKQEPSQENDKVVKKPGKKQPSCKGDGVGKAKVPVNSTTCPEDDSVQSNKENLETPRIEVTSAAEEVI